MGGVFICYRREDSAGFARLVYDRLSNKLGHDNVFLDVDNIPVGLDFVDILSERVGKCDALIAVIGKGWTTSADIRGRRRLDDPDDFVRIEIEAALERKIRVVPVLVDGAAMPSADDLPDCLKKLTRRQGIEVSHSRFDSDVERLTRALALLDEDLRQREATERATREEQERRAAPEAARSADAALPAAEIEPKRQAMDEERRAGRAAAAAAPVEASAARSVERRVRYWGAPLALAGAVAGAAALVVVWSQFASFSPPLGNTPTVQSSASARDASKDWPSAAPGQSGGTTPTPTAPPAERGLTAVEENQTGDRYFYGSGVGQDFGKAMEWYRKAADHGSAVAQKSLGALYLNGWGVPKDIDQAKAWYQKAANQGDAFAVGILRRLQSDTPAAQTQNASADSAAAIRPQSPRVLVSPAAPQPVEQREPNVNWSSSKDFEITNDRPGASWLVYYTVSGKFATDGHNVYFRVNRLELHSNPSFKKPIVKIASLQIGVCYNEPDKQNGAWNISPVKRIIGENDVETPVDVEQDKNYNLSQFPDLLAQSDASIDLTKAWPCTLLWTAEGGNLPGHPTERKTIL